MIKTNQHDESVADLLIDLNSGPLADEQMTMREQAIIKVAEKFAKSLAKNALATRTDYVDQVFTRLGDDLIFTWPEHARLCVALGDIRTRDGLLRKLHDESKLRPQVCRHLTREIVRAGEPWVSALATVFGGIVWLAGYPDQTRIAIDRALECDPSYSLALLLDIALRHNVPASVWSASLEAVSFEACLKGAA